MATSPHHSHGHGRVSLPESGHILAVFATDLAIHLATSCRILPLLPPITPNVKLPRAANPLEFEIRMRDDADHTMKSGKNGNVNHPSQHCHMDTRSGMTEVS